MSNKQLQYQYQYPKHSLNRSIEPASYAYNIIMFI